jgi:hypothetical protein
LLIHCRQQGYKVADLPSFPKGRKEMKFPCERCSLYKYLSLRREVELRATSTNLVKITLISLIASLCN